MASLCIILKILIKKKEYPIQLAPSTITILFFLFLKYLFNKKNCSTIFMGFKKKEFI